jgi:1-acyl-sn-glycerol-3-phosphate acyltransferase
MKSFYRLTWLLTDFLSKILWRFEKKGRENIPLKGGAIIACNHISYFDPPLVGTAVPREIFYLAKEELFKNRFLGGLLGKLNSLAISRGAFDRAGLKKAMDVVKGGEVLLLFPEGTRSLNGSLGKAKSGAGKIALEALVPIVPAYISNSRNLIKSLFFRRKISVIFGEPISSKWLEKLPKNRTGYRVVGEEIMQRIRELKERSKDR